MALTSWKAFRFFDVSQIKLPSEVSLEQSNVSCVVPGENEIITGSPDGTVQLLDQNFQLSRTWKAHDANLTHAKQITDTPYLVTLAEDLLHEPELKVWDLKTTEKKSKLPKCLCTITVQNGRKSFPVTSFAVTSDITEMAIGFGNGAVTVVRGDFIHDRGTKQRTVFESEEPITGLEFREASTTALYIATTAHIRALVVAGNKQGAPARTLDNHGCAIGCMTLEPQSNDIVVAREDAIYSYSLRGKVASYAYEGAKKLVGVHKDYVLVASPPKSNNMASAALRAFGGTQAETILNSTTFTILNTDLKFVAHSETLSSEVNTIFSMWGDIFVLTVDGKLLRHHEKLFKQKMDILSHRNLFVLAISLAQKYQVDASQQSAIFRRYGDYLYQKGDYDTAMQQYLRAIDNTEPSQIIRKYLDNQHLGNLVDYLEALHEEGKASSDHTTLLLNCYAKLKDSTKLEEFIHQPGELKFDLDTAITMCRQGGYYEQAAFLARRHEEHGLVVDIMVEDLKWYAEAVAYIMRLDPADAFQSLMKFGTVLLEHRPAETTRLYIDHFTGQYRPKKDAIIMQETSAETADANGASKGFGTAAKSAVQNLVSFIPLPGMAVAATPVSEQQTTQVVETVSEEFVEYNVPKPRLAFASFIDHADEFIEFLEALISSDHVGEKAELRTTLFEMYLHKAGETKAEEKTEWERKAKQLIAENDVPIDTSSVLLLSDLEKFREGTILVSERRGLKYDVFRSYTAARDTKGAIKALHKYGSEEPQLYAAALAYFTSSPDILKEAGDEVEKVLTKIDEDGLMAPLQVIQTLSVTPVATMGLVKRYLSTVVQREQDEIAANRRLVDSYRKDTTTKLGEIEELSTTPVSFSSTRCSTCGMTLDLPTVHFLCKHSYHQRCLNVADERDVDEIECPICAPKNAIVRQVKKAQEESASRHDLFEDDLQRSKDRFGTVSEWFGRGIVGGRVE
ncbi:vacuolar protein sorting-associated protein 11 [Piedraia hortae CBS 480.64]|uniref:E3 ubiquitin-protein ligase PEP5 n=1 Tax=Piedraia hortae CBS 480.64 TaxID=1314780 RepID=A0A6A7C2Z5_9PEZI|nr:vacuolar protein sorting-associated protein 11 [Piedraia hortae CBS 480.64]